MLLQHLYEFAETRGLLDQLPFSKAEVRWIVHLDMAGNVCGDGPQATDGGEDRALEMDCPQTNRPTGSGQVSDFLVDDIGAIFGLNTKPHVELNQRAAANLHAKHKDFLRHLRRAELVTRRPEFSAIRKFIKSLAAGSPQFLTLSTEGRLHWRIRTASGQEVRLGADRWTFAVQGAPTPILLNDPDVQAFWRRVWEWELRRESKANRRGFCLVTGARDVPISRTHIPPITGLRKPASSTAYLVSGDKDAFQSYGLEQAYNAPTSLLATKGYLKALQHLAGHQDHWLWTGPAWLCFWPQRTEPVSGLFAQLLKAPHPDSVRKFIASPWSGIEKPPLDPDREKFHAVTLTATKSRIVVKDWLETTLQDAAKNLQTWFLDLEIQPIRWSDQNSDEDRTPLAIRWLACTTLRPDSSNRFDFDKLKPELPASLYRAALTGAAPSIALLKPILDRLAANMAKTGTRALNDQSRFALLRLIINRHHRTRKEHNMEIPSQAPKITASTNDPAYNCGRLLSVFNNLQRSAHSGTQLNTTIAERYFASASTNPNAAFSILWRLHQHHLKKLRQKGATGQRAAHRIKETIAGICSKLRAKQECACPEMPRVFMLVDQGRFALGFYHQEAERAEAIRLWRERQKAAGKVADAEIQEEEI